MKQLYIFAILALLGTPKLEASSLGWTVSPLEGHLRIPFSMPDGTPATLTGCKVYNSLCNFQVLLSNGSTREYRLFHEEEQEETKTLEKLIEELLRSLKNP
ncbi:MAG: hypothetical protein LBU15_03310 [Rickettsiales bacterium]|nr:hypothetical protein [Rickettsiales bacterium]